MNPNLLPQLNPAAIDALRAMMQVLESALAAALPPPEAPRRTVQEVGNEFLVAKARSGKTACYLKNVRAVLNALFHAQLSRPVHTITAQEIEEWVSKPEWSPHYRRDLITAARTFFAFAIGRGYAASNPASTIEVPKFTSTAPRIQTPEQVSVVLETAHRLDQDVMRLLVISYFGGLRSCEAQRLVESEIGDKYIEVKAEKSKTRRRRLITINPTLRAWLSTGGQLPVNNLHQRLATLKKAAGVPFPSNAARHCFCSYHIAHFRNAAVTALEAGHGEAVLFRFYREVVTPEDAARYWRIFPKGVSLDNPPANVVSISTMLDASKAA